MAVIRKVREVQLLVRFSLIPHNRKQEMSKEKNFDCSLKCNSRDKQSIPSKTFGTEGLRFEFFGNYHVFVNTVRETL